MSLWRSKREGRVWREGSNLLHLVASPTLDYSWEPGLTSQKEDPTGGCSQREEAELHGVVQKVL